MNYFDRDAWCKESAPIKGLHKSELIIENRNGEYEENMFIQDIGRPSQPLPWILQEINKRVRIQQNNNLQMVSPELQELDYADELSEIVLEYVDEIIHIQELFQKYQVKRVSTQSFVDKKRTSEYVDVA